MLLSHDEARIFLKQIGYKFGGARGGTKIGILYRMKSPTGTEWQEFNIQEIQNLATRLYKIKAFL